MTTKVASEILRALRRLELAVLGDKEAGATGLVDRTEAVERKIANHREHVAAELAKRDKTADEILGILKELKDQSLHARVTALENERTALQNQIKGGLFTANAIRVAVAAAVGLLSSFVAIKFVPKEAPSQATAVATGPAKP